MDGNRILFLYGQPNEARASQLAEKLNELGVQVISTREISDAEGQTYEEQLRQLVLREKFIVFFISEKTILSTPLLNEIFLAYEIARDRDKVIIPIVEWHTILEKNEQLRSLLADQDVIFPQDGLHARADHTEVAARIYEILNITESKELLYEKISAFKRIKYIPGLSTNLCKLILILCDEAEKEYRPRERREKYKEILRCMVTLETCYESGFDKQSKDQARARINALGRIKTLLQHPDFHKIDLYLIALAIRWIHLDSEIRYDCIDTLSNGDVHGISRDALEDYLSRQDFYAKLYQHQMILENISPTNHGTYPDDEIELILNVPKFLMANTYRVRPHAAVETEPISEEEKQLHAIADYIRESNKLFELISSNSAAYEFLKCLKTSYERLRKYSEVVGCLDVCAECIERIAEINQKLQKMDSQQEGSSKIETGIKALLGFSLPGTDDYDVFISYKHEDADIARNIYHFLRSNLLNPFFDEVTLPELSNSEYEDAIMASLERSKHFVLVLSNLAYLDSHWVELEMKTFRHEMVEGRKSGANFLMIVTDSVYNEIISTNKKCLPIQYRSCEIMRVSTYKNTISSYLK